LKPGGSEVLGGIRRPRYHAFGFRRRALAYSREVRIAQFRAAITALRGDELRALVAGAPADDGLEARVLTALAKALLGRTDEALREAAAARALAITASSPAAACDAASIRALATATSGDLEGATELARRASMMSRTEALHEQETLANLVLARVRRLTGRPFLATRILGALARFSSPAWRPWIDWEHAMAGGATATPAPPGDDAASALATAIDRARLGNRSEFADSMARALARMRGLTGHLADLDATRIALDPDADAGPIDAPLARWRRGLDDEVPRGLLGLTTPADPGDASVFVLARPGARGTRILGPGAPLVEATGVARLPQMQRRQGRTDTALAVLALAGEEGLPDDELFRAAYGFAFSHSVHGGVLDVLLHRARAHVGAAGEITRSRGVLALAVRTPLLLVDPRCAPHDDDRVLQLVARCGRMSAKDTSQQLGLPLRSAQAALEALVATGACTRERNGRAIEYRVDDTTFQEPTGQRV
jgi:hypothetical protein